ncbi:efflux RND transporter periplasmic adaptor subunit [Paraburkholderia terrae]
MNYVSRPLAANLLLTLMLTTGCGRHAPPPEVPLRAVKLELVRGMTNADLPVTGLVRAQQRADLSFELSGRIASIEVDVGDIVHRGQTLARLDMEPVRLRLQQARADSDSAKAQLAEREMTYRQQQALFDDRIVSPATLAAARAAYQVAVDQLNSARATEALAARAIRNSSIVAPFDGRVVGRTVQPLADIAAGHGVLQIESQGRVEVVSALPAALAVHLKPGVVAVAHPTDEPSRAVSIRLQSISSRVDNGAVVQGIFCATDAGTALRSGESVLLTLPTDQPTLPSVPVTALLPATSGQRARVFVYDPRNGRVLSRTVVTEAVSDGRVLLREGVGVGETVVATGAQFLFDGQAVRRFQSETQIGQE